MMNQRNRAGKGIVVTMLSFAVPFLISAFLQTFYGLCDLFIAGQFNGADVISGVSIGSQVTHMLTVVIVGLCMGTTVMIGRKLGEKKEQETKEIIAATVALFTIVAVVLTGVCFLLKSPILSALKTPEEALSEASSYLLICYAGIPFITAYNVIAAIFRGFGDTRHPMYFVAIAGVINIVLDVVLVGPMGLRAAGAALATVISQAVSVVISLIYLMKQKTIMLPQKADFKSRAGHDKEDFKDAAAIGTVNFIGLAALKTAVGEIIRIGMPIAAQDAFIQVSFLVITAIANNRGVEVAAAVGIVEKMISFLFLVPSAMLSTVSALAAKKAGAAEHAEARRILRIGIETCVIFGSIIAVLIQFFAGPVVGLFVSDDARVVVLGTQYFRTYVIDCMIAGVHFCFSGFFSAYGKSGYSFLHNIISILTIRIPGAYLASVLFPTTLYAMGIAAPAGSLLSVLICLWLYRKIQ